MRAEYTVNGVLYTGTEEEIMKIPRTASSFGIMRKYMVNPTSNDF